MSNGPATAHPYADIPPLLLARLRSAGARLQMLDPWERFVDAPLLVELPGAPRACVDFSAMLSSMMMLYDSIEDWERARKHDWKSAPLRMRVRVVFFEHVRTRGGGDIFPVLMTVEEGRERSPTAEDASATAAAMEAIVRLAREYPAERWPFDLGEPPTRHVATLDWLPGEVAVTLPHPEYARLLFGVTQTELAAAVAAGDACPICRKLDEEVAAGRAVMQELEDGVVVTTSGGSSGPIHVRRTGSAHAPIGRLPGLGYAETPGRNGGVPLPRSPLPRHPRVRCPCGSGRRYNRCCQAS